jgi:cytochrome c556
MSFRVQLAAVTMTALAGICFSPLAASAQSVEETVKARTALMDSFDDASKILIVSAKAGTADAATAKAAEDISAGLKKVPGLFPAGSGGDKIKSRAKPEIWADFAKFEGYAKDADAAFTAVAAAAKAGDGAGVTTTFAKAVASCTACHRDYRGPRQQ